MADMTDKAIKWVRQQKALMPDKPFFAYFAPGATHAPHHVTPEWADKYKGAFDDGWDALRERTFARQKELGVIPADAELTARHDEIPAWDEMPEELKPVLRRQMEIYAGFLEFTDHHVGRLLDALEGLGVLEHSRLLHHRRQRRLGRGHAERHLQRDDQLQRRRTSDTAISARACASNPPAAGAATSTEAASPRAVARFAWRASIPQETQVAMRASVCRAARRDQRAVRLSGELGGERAGRARAGPWLSSRASAPTRSRRGRERCRRAAGPSRRPPIRRRERRHPRSSRTCTHRRAIDACSCDDRQAPSRTAAGWIPRRRRHDGGCAAESRSVGLR